MELDSIRGSLLFLTFFNAFLVPRAFISTAEGAEQGQLMDT